MSGGRVAGVLNADNPSDFGRLFVNLFGKELIYVFLVR